MVSFRLAAIQILREANEPLHYEEITKRAIEKNLIETSGETPEATMNSIIVTNIKNKKDKSPFVKVKPSTYQLNSNYSKEEQKTEELEEKIKEEDIEQIGTQYIGKAGEHLVVSELLFKGYNASIMDVDVGMDIVATKNERLYNIQVKTSNENKFNNYVFDIRITSFEKYNSNNCYYIFILKGLNTNFLILPFIEIQKNIDLKNILVINKATRYRVNVKIRDNKLYLGNLNNDLTYYLNNWSILK